MGFNTAAIILNDGINGLTDDAGFGERLYREILSCRRTGGVVSIGNHANACKILPSQHADTTQIVAIGQNTIVPLGYSMFSASDKERVVRDMARDLGFDLRKRRQS